MRMWFRPVKGIAFCIVAAFFGSQAMAQVQVIPGLHLSFRFPLLSSIWLICIY